MAKATTKDGMLRVKFVGMPGPPARLEVGEVVIEAGQVAELPEALARELAANPSVGLELTDEPLAAPSEEPEQTVEENANGPILQHVNPEPSAEAPAEEKE
jgi:hypothetical protein